MAQYEIPRGPRFRHEKLVDGIEFVIPASRNWVIMGFLTIWLSFWTLGGGAAIYAAFTQTEPFLFIWLVFWAIAWLLVASQLAYAFVGCEFIRSRNGDLEIGYRAWLLSKSWHYRGSEVSDLAACDGPDFFSRIFTWGWTSSPIYAARRIGTLRFRHGARTIYAGNSLDRAESELIVNELRRLGVASGH